MSKTLADRSVDILERSKTSIGKLMERLTKTRAHIDWCHKVILDCYHPIYREDGFNGRCRLMGLQGWRGSPRCNHTASKDGVCGQHWNIIFSHEWNFTGARKYNKALDFEAFCSLCGVRRSAATLQTKCPQKGERKWLEKELSDLRSRL